MCPIIFYVSKSLVNPNISMNLMLYTAQFRIFVIEILYYENRKLHPRYLTIVF